MTNILVLSAHDGHLDRRIVAEINTLVRSGRRVTLVSVPTRVPRECLDDRVRVIAPAVSPTPFRFIRQRIAELLPQRFHGAAQWVWQHLSRCSDPLRLDYFSELTPRDCYDVIHCHDLSTLPAAVRIRGRFAPHAKLIYDSHELFPYQTESHAFQQYWRRIECEHIGEADRVITVNESLADEFASQYGIRRPQVIYNSYDNNDSGAYQPPLSRDEFYERFRADNDGFRVLFQGSFARDRNLLGLVEAFGLLGSSFQLFLLGAGACLRAIERLRMKLGLSNVWFGGWVQQHELLRYTAHADLGIIPYRGSSRLLNMLYCTPNKLFEFIEAQVPVCASDLPELTRIVQAHRIGKVYPMNDPQEIAEAIHDCRARCQEGEFSSRVLESAREHFSWEHQGKRLVETYDALGV